MPRSPEVVEYDPRDIYVAIECLITKNQGSDSTSHATRIDHKEHREVQQDGKCGIAVTAIQRQTIIKSLVALDQVNLRTVAIEVGDDLVALRAYLTDIGIPRTATGILRQLPVLALVEGTSAEPPIVGKFIEASIPFASMSRTRWWTSKQPGRSSV